MTLIQFLWPALVFLSMYVLRFKFEAVDVAECKDFRRIPVNQSTLRFFTCFRSISDTTITHPRNSIALFPIVHLHHRQCVHRLKVLQWNILLSWCTVSHAHNLNDLLMTFYRIVSKNLLGWRRYWISFNCFWTMNPCTIQWSVCRAVWIFSA